MTRIAEKKTPLRVIVNEADVIENVCAHMRQPLKKYVGFKSSIDEWKEIEALYPGSVSVRIANVPLFHRLYIIRNEDGTGAVNIKYYTYGSYNTEKDVRQCFSTPSREYRLYAEEFDYIWDHACSANDPDR